MSKPINFTPFLFAHCETLWIKEGFPDRSAFLRHVIEEFLTLVDGLGFREDLEQLEDRGMIKQSNVVRTLSIYPDLVAKFGEIRDLFSVSDSEFFRMCLLLYSILEKVGRLEGWLNLIA